LSPALTRCIYPEAVRISGIPATSTFRSAPRRPSSGIPSLTHISTFCRPDSDMNVVNIRWKAAKLLAVAPNARIPFFFKICSFHMGRQYSLAKVLAEIAFPISRDSHARRMEQREKSSSNLNRCSSPRPLMYLFSIRNDCGHSLGTKSRTALLTYRARVTHRLTVDRFFSPKISTNDFSVASHVPPGTCDLILLTRDALCLTVGGRIYFVLLHANVFGAPCARCHRKSSTLRNPKKDSSSLIQSAVSSSNLVQSAFAFCSAQINRFPLLNLNFPSVVEGSPCLFSERTDGPFSVVFQYSPSRIQVHPLSSATDKSSRGTLSRLVTRNPFIPAFGAIAPKRDGDTRR
jgi:hypothetical protein